MKIKSYHKLTNILENYGISHRLIGFVMAESIVENFFENVRFYSSEYYKVYRNKENTKTFNSLEKLIDGKKQDILDKSGKIKKEKEDYFADKFSKASAKAGEEVLRINFAFDALNFYMNNSKINSNYNLEKTYEFMYKSLMILKKSSVIKKNIPSGVKDPRVNEYIILLKKYRHNLEEEFGALFQR